MREAHRHLQRAQFERGAQAPTEGTALERRTGAYRGHSSGEAHRRLQRAQLWRGAQAPTEGTALERRTGAYRGHSS